ncbi:glyoxal oxidase [Rhizopogon vinicolor AM-OR11-026]|uniref:Glyoxal oxidase n=1 Tax=Rhizopogon vinicolor AM-OR11-026 TaxID=1314800 RepID=A0A1B7MXU0_9AGAM|nr:glyoxal oxidase [Rhizopogon vinicolor AM-OR11-026]
MTWLTSPKSLVPAFCILSAVGRVLADNAPGQPKQADKLNGFEITGSSLASGQQIFLGTEDKVYIVDKTENNPTQINGHPIWAAEWSVSANQARPMDAVTNSFCAGGSVLGNGTWLNVGGNQAVTYGGATAKSELGGLPYDDPDGGQSIRMLNPCDGQNCDWVLLTPMTTRRWYPTLETLQDGSIIIFGGCGYGGYVNDASQDNPTYEFFPSRGMPIPSPILQNTLPVNLYPILWLLPSGKLFVQSGWSTILLDLDLNQETQLQDMPDAVRVYPASGGNAMLPLTPDNKYTATIMFCGGSNISYAMWTQNWDIPHWPASTSCVQITPDQSPNYIKLDSLPESRTMGNLILLPDGRVLCLNGAGIGTAGYGNTTFTIGQSYADQPVLTPIIYDPNAPSGQRWSRDGLSPSTVPRMYHSSATLLPDGSVFVTGSNPNSDVNTTAPYPTEYRIEHFYPSYYNQRRPEPQGLPSQLSYGGSYFNISLSLADLFSNVDNIQSTKVMVMRTGFSTHTMNMGMRSVQLNNTFTGNADGSGVLHVSPLPPSAAIMPPGPALLFVVVNGVPSVGIQVMCGSGNIEQQKMLTAPSLPSSSIVQQQNGQPSKNSGASFVVLSARGVLLGAMKYVGAVASAILLFVS